MKIFGKTSTLLALCLALLLAIGLFMVYQDYSEETAKNEKMEEQLAILTAEAKRSAVMQHINAQMEEIAVQQRRISDEQRDEAERQTERAEAERLRAEEERQNALEAQQRAINASRTAEHQRAEAEQQRTKAQYQKRVADTLSYINLARQLGEQAIKQKETGNTQLANLLAYASQVFTSRYRGDVYATGVYQSLVMTSISKHQWARHKGTVHDLAFYGKDDHRILTCSSYGELMEHTVIGDKLTTETLFQDNRYDFRDIFVDRKSLTIYAVSRNGALIIGQRKSLKQLEIKEIGPLLKIEPLGSSMIVYGESGLALLDPKTTTVTCTKPLSFKVHYVNRPEDDTYMFDDKGRMHVVRSIDDITTTQVPIAGEVTAFSCNKSNGLQAYGLKNGTIYLVYPKGKTLKLTGHRSRISKLKLTGWLLYSSSYDGTVNLWRTDHTKIEPMTIITNSGWLANFTFDLSKESLWCLDNHGCIIEALISIPKMQQQLKALLSRDFTPEEWDYYIGSNIPYESFLERRKE